MLHIEDEKVRKLLFKGNFGLEKENLRITGDGFFAHTFHPFPDDPQMTRDFSENQLEINTKVFDSVDAVVASLTELTEKVQLALAGMQDREYLWPFSNPPYIRNEADIPIAQFFGEERSRTDYRHYLDERYGKYKMTYSGIHVNFSFADELLLRSMEAECAVGGSDHSGSMEAECRSKKAESGSMEAERGSTKTDADPVVQHSLKEYKNTIYLDLAEKMAACGWLLTAVTAASPLMDRSFMEKGVFGGESFSGLASVRCSEQGYWNLFPPIFDYDSIEGYSDSIQKYVDDDLIGYPSELYYPIRLKPPGKNDHIKLKREGVDHIELRMFDLHPLEPAGLNKKDVIFAHLMMVWLASIPRTKLSPRRQIEAAQNFKSAAHYDLKMVKLVSPDNRVMKFADAAVEIISRMKRFYNELLKNLDIDTCKTYMIHEILDFEESKFVDPENRYAWQIRDMFRDDYVRKGLELAKKQQQEIVDRHR